VLDCDAQGRGESGHEGDNGKEGKDGRAAEREGARNLPVLPVWNQGRAFAIWRCQIAIQRCSGESVMSHLLCFKGSADSSSYDALRPAETGHHKTARDRASRAFPHRQWRS